MRFQPGVRVEKRKGRGWRLRWYKPRLVKYAQKRPTAVFQFRYEREDGMWRTISVPVGSGRFKRGRNQDALALAERRLNEQFGDLSVAYARKIKNVSRVEENPELHQDNYQLVSVTRL